jgi:hypothetical protein
VALIRAEIPNKMLENRMTPMMAAKNLDARRLGVDDASMAQLQLPC